MKKFEVGNKVKTIAQGYGVVNEINMGASYPVTVNFNGWELDFTINGWFTERDTYRTLYHADETFINPPNPMKKVKICGWATYFKSELNDKYILTTVSETKESAEAIAKAGNSSITYLETEIEVEG